MRCRTFAAFALTLSLFGFANGCDSKPKIVMPTEKAPHAPRPHVTGGGGGEVEPAPDAQQKEKLPKPNEAPVDPPPPEDKK